MVQERDLPEVLVDQLENYATGFLSKGREEWDIPHTKAVVHHIEQIANAEGLDVLVLITTGWLHDIGYYALFEDEESKQYGHIMDKKAMHMINGARLAEDFFKLPSVKDFYTQEQMKRVIHLVSVHDKIEELKDPDEIAFMEADTLGAIDVSKVTPTFNKQDAKKYIDGLLSRRRPRFQTATGINAFNELFPNFLAHFGFN